MSYDPYDDDLDAEEESLEFDTHIPHFGYQQAPDTQQELGFDTHTPMVGFHSTETELGSGDEPESAPARRIVKALPASFARQGITEAVLRMRDGSIVVLKGSAR